MNFWNRHRLEASVLLLGVAHALSFAPGPLPAWALPLVQLLCFGLFAHYLLLSASLRQVAWRAFLFGFATFATGLYWLHTSMHLYGGMPSLLAVAAVALLAAAMALYGTAAASLAWWLSWRHPRSLDSALPTIGAAAVFASCWTLGEWLRGTLFTGFPWLNVGYAHVDGLFSGWAILLGVYGVAWLVAFAAAALALFAQARREGNDRRAGIVVGLALLSGIIGILIKPIPWVSPHGEPILVRLAQGAIPQSEKFDPALLRRGLDTYLEIAALPPKAPDAVPDVILMPETVVPLFQNRVSPELWQRWQQVAAQHKAAILLGVPLHDGGTDARYTNSVIAITPETTPQQVMQTTLPWRYDKHHLVPFGEFVPPGFRWFVDTMNIPLGDFARGATVQAPYAHAGQRIAPNICYEDVFGEEIIPAVRGSEDTEGATILANMSNLAWFGNSWALRQHLQISRMRSLETGRPMLRATNTGMTAAIDPRGQVRASLPPDTPGALDVEVQGTTGFTPYVRWGNMPVLFLCAMVLGLAFGQRRAAPSRVA